VTVDQAELTILYVRRVVYHSSDCSTHVNSVIEQGEHAWAEARIGDVLTQSNTDARSPMQASATDTDAGRRNGGPKLARGFVPGSD
jgi:hypothetical protein